jgi:hypothetical protein
MDEKTQALAMLGTAFVLMLLAFVTGGTLGPLTFVVLLIALLACPTSIIIYKYGYWMIPYFTRGLRVIRTQDAMVDIPPTEDVLVKQEGGTYMATVFLAVKIFKTTTGMGEDEKVSFMNLWERAVSGMKSVVKFGLLVYIKDLSKYKDSIESRKAKAQMLLGQEREKPNPSQPTMDKTEREIAMWDNMLSKISYGEKPTAITTFIQASATGATKDSAIAAARQRASEIRATVGTALNVEVVPMSGEEMRRCFDWAYAIPMGIKEL